MLENAMHHFADLILAPFELVGLYAVDHHLLSATPQRAMKFAFIGTVIIQALAWFHLGMP